MKPLQYSKKNNKNIKKIIFLLIIIAVILFILLLLASSVGKSKNMIFNIATPIWKWEENITGNIKNSMSLFTSKAALIEENNRLKSKIEEFSSVQLSRDLLLKENDILKKELGRRDEKKDQVIATILVRPNKSPYDTLIIDVGSNNDIKVGDKVVTGGMAILGEVAEVFPKSSKVLLYSSSDVTTDVIIGEDNISASAKGRGGFNFEINIPRDLDIKEGAIISLPGADNNYILGVVGVIQSSPQDAFQKILFKTPVNIQHLKWVNVVRD